MSCWPGGQRAGVVFGLHLVVLYTPVADWFHLAPVGWRSWPWIVGLAAVAMVLIELAKEQEESP